MEEHVYDLVESWQVVYLSVLFAIIFGYLYVFVMRSCAKCMTWTSIIMFFLTLFIGGLIMFAKAKKIGPYQNDKEEDLSDSQLQIFGIFFWLVGVCYVLYICCNWNKIRLSIAIMGCA